MKIAANLTFMFNEVGGLLKRYEAAASAGFKYVECANPYTENLEQISALKERLNLEQVLINAPVGKVDEGGGFGIACIPKKKNEFRDSISEAIRYAKRLNCPRIHVMAGKTPGDVLRIEAEEMYVENIKFAAGEMANVVNFVNLTVKKAKKFY